MSPHANELQQSLTPKRAPSTQAPDKRLKRESHGFGRQSYRKTASTIGSIIACTVYERIIVTPAASNPEVQCSAGASIRELQLTNTMALEWSLACGYHSAYLHVLVAAI